MPLETDKHSDVVRDPSQETGAAAALHSDAYAQKAGAKTARVASSETQKSVDFGTSPDLYGRTQLLTDAETNIKNSDQLQQFKSDLKAAETRAVKQNISAEQMTAAYKSVDALLTSDSNRPTAASDRVILAEQVVGHMARPDDVGQGNYATCGAATMEVETYRYHPEAAAQMVSSIALVGHFDTKDGNEIAVDAQPVGESVDPKTHQTLAQNFSYQRDYASQLFQVGAMDVGILNGNRGDAASKASDLHYVEDSIGGAAIYTDARGQTHREPNYGLTPEELAKGYGAITGDKIGFAARFKN